MLQANLNPGSTFFSLDLERAASFDRAGRLEHLFDRGRTFKRSLASSIYRRSKADGRRWVAVEEGAARAVIATAYELAGAARVEAEPELAKRLDEEILPWEIDDLLGEAERFSRVYQPISILPPDCYRNVVLQATQGCTWNECTFCNFYMDRPFTVSSPAQFAEHVVAVKAFMGAGLSARSGVFLADGNALAVGLRRLRPLVEIACEAFPGEDLFGFIDLYSGERRGDEHWSELTSRGLRRVYLGLETGLDDLLAWVNKPGGGVEQVEFVRQLKDSGLAVGLILMVGLGGAHFRDRHAEASWRAIERMELSTGDIVYLSPFVEHPGSEYQRRRRAAGFQPMSATLVEEEMKRWFAALRRPGLKVSRYEIREFIY